ncbi:phosphodiester glycosidase family protein [Caulobacter sp. UNC358MFTsu5.1]|uniref:phosphodiester glycosidase family protein n=1 Tax=Caulobacter sp. UNC358MFTsu5.1 TaxID=1449049 RepID=UPI0009E07022|nr:phosphodiester glycosidase family protein [Caulobacter sp. UNC358MFTsu5.1]
MPRVMLRAALAFVFAILAVSAAATANAQPPPTNCQYQNPTSPQTLFPGVSYQAVTVVCSAQQPQHTTLAHVLSIDVGSGSITLDSSAAASSATFGLTLPSQFLTATKAALAVNANLFAANCCYYSAAQQGWPTQLCGWQVSGGVTQSPQGAKPTGWQADYPFNASLVQMKDGEVRILYSNTPQAIEFPVVTAVTGSHMLVFGGKSLGPFSGSSTDFFGPNARTLAGLSKDRKTLWLVALDKASTGLTLDEAAAVMLHQGAAAAVNLDGGGSSTMVQASGGGFAFLNVPPDPAKTCLAGYPSNQDPATCERLVGASLGIHVAGQGARPK